jgi:hypothetical protein
MTNFQLGLAVGGFLGALVIVVVLGIIQLYVEERQEKNACSMKQTAPPGLGEVSHMQPYTDYEPSDYLALEKPVSKEEAVIYYLFILIE